MKPENRSAVGRDSTAAIWYATILIAISIKLSENEFLVTTEYIQWSKTADCLIK